MALKSSREGLRKELVDYLGNLIVDDNLRNEIIKVVGDNFVTSENLNEAVNNLTMQITTENGGRIEADDTLQNNITAEATAREEADTTLQNNITAEATAREEADTTLQDNINAETIARQEAITNLEGMISTSGLQMDLLWTNASLTSAFAPQTTNLDLSEYSIIGVIFKYERPNSNRNSVLLIALVDGSETLFQMGSEADANNIRRLGTVSTTGIVWGSGGFSSTTDNDYARPYKIYGIK